MINLNKTQYTFYNKLYLKPVFTNKRRKMVDNIHDVVIQKGYLPVSEDTGLVYDRKNKVFLLLKRDGDILAYTDVIRCVLNSNNFTLIVSFNLDNKQTYLCEDILNKALCAR